ncbi:MAG: N-acetyltransferase [Dehalococcoidia bacterium]
MIRVEAARLSDARDIEALVRYWADRDQMLHRPLNEVYESIRDFKVARDDVGRVVGCGSLHIMGPDLAEVRSLAVAEEAQGMGVGAAIVSACIEEAKALGIERVFALTYRPGFFERQGFHLANVMEFPQKVWNECVRCPFFTNCREVAVVVDLVERPELAVPMAEPMEATTRREGMPLPPPAARER